MSHQLPVRVYYEDTDAGGVVYYANYLKYLERGRTDCLRALGVEQRRLAEETGIAFMVRAIQVEYLRPARLDDELFVTTAIEAQGRAQVTFAQTVRRADTVLLTARVRVACIELARNRPTALPDGLHQKLKAFSKH
jgi:acyl-CoA thioester hydrolase